MRLQVLQRKFPGREQTRPGKVLLGHAAEAVASQSLATSTSVRDRGHVAMRGRERASLARHGRKRAVPALRRKALGGGGAADQARAVAGGDIAHAAAVLDSRVATERRSARRDVKRPGGTRHATASCEAGHVGHTAERLTLLPGGCRGSESDGEGGGESDADDLFHDCSTFLYRVMGWCFNDLKQLPSYF